MPMEESSEFPILAYSRREDPRDVLIYKSEKKEQGTEEGSILTKTGAVIGTSSKRRMIQIQKLYPNAVFQGIRGNIQTRLSKLNKEEYDAAVLAAAGVKRLNMEAVIGRYFSVDEVIPAAGCLHRKRSILQRFSYIAPVKAVVQSWLWNVIRMCRKTDWSGWKKWKESSK